MSPAAVIDTAPVRFKPVFASMVIVPPVEVRVRAPTAVVTFVIAETIVE